MDPDTLIQSIYAYKCALWGCDGLKHLHDQCSQPSGGPAGPRRGTAKSPGRDGTASCSPSRPPSEQDGRLWVGRRALQGETC